MKKPRLFYLDLIRVVALGCILVIHFNATVTGYFTLPHKLFTSTLPFGIYLGDFGSSLFFIVSGASLCYTARDDFSARVFYKKRALAVYPMFWLAWAICFSLRFVLRPGYYAGAWTETLLLTVLGLDNFALAAGWVGQDFACVGEWFLGSILFLYLLFPLLLALCRRAPYLGMGLAAVIGVAVHMVGWDARLIAIHLPEFYFGMLFVTLARRGKAVCLVSASFLLGLAWWSGVRDGKIVCALFSMAVFVLLALVGERIRFAPVQRLCAKIGTYSYAVFLVHHVLILRMVEKFDLAQLSRRDTGLLFLAYLCLTWLLSWGLFRLDRSVRAGAAGLVAQG